MSLRADAVRTITREEGALALYKGAVPALLLCGQGAVQFTVYEWLKARVPKQNENVSNTFFFCSQLHVPSVKLQPELKREYGLLCAGSVNLTVYHCRIPDNVVNMAVEYIVSVEDNFV